MEDALSSVKDRIIVGTGALERVEAAWGTPV